jgi:hypothetical protein
MKKNNKKQLKLDNPSGNEGTGMSYLLNANFLKENHILVIDSGRSYLSCLPEKIVSTQIELYGPEHTDEVEGLVEQGLVTLVDVGHSYVKWLAQKGV